MSHPIVTLPEEVPVGEMLEVVVSFKLLTSSSLAFEKKKKENPDPGLLRA